MSQEKLGVKAFGATLLAALGLIVFMTAGAQASWLYLLGVGTADVITLNELVKINKHSADFTLLMAGVNLKILCQTLIGNDFLLEPGNATTANALGGLAFGTCTGIEKSTGKEIKNCNPINQPIELLVRALVILHTNGQNYVLFEPDSGTTFTEIKFSELCALSTTTKVTGDFVAECGLLNGSGVFVQEDCKNHQVIHLLQQAPEALFPSDVLKYGTHVATIDGIATADLAGDHPGASWSGEV